MEDGATNSVAEVQTQQALINLEADETVICTFTNHKIEVPLPGPQNAANLIPLVDSRIQSVSQWSIRDASFLPSQSRLDDGSGSIALAGTTIVLGPSVNVIPGHRYTCGIYFQGDSIPTTLRLGLKVFDLSTLFRTNN